MSHPDHSYMKPTPENLALMSVKASARYAPIPQEARALAQTIKADAGRLAGYLAQCTTFSAMEAAETVLFGLEEQINRLRLELEGVR